MSTDTEFADIMKPERRAARGVITDYDRQILREDNAAVFKSILDAREAELGITPTPEGHYKFRKKLEFVEEAMEGTQAAKKALVKTVGGAVLTGSGLWVWSGWATIKAAFAAAFAVAPK